MASRRLPSKSPSAFSRSRNEWSKGDRSAHQFVNQGDGFQANSGGRKRARSESQNESPRRVVPNSPGYRGWTNPNYVKDSIWQHVNLPEAKRVATLVSKRGGKSNPGMVRGQLRENNRGGDSKPRVSDGGSNERYLDQTRSRIDERKGSVGQASNSMDASPNRPIRERHRSLGDGYSSVRPLSRDGYRRMDNPVVQQPSPSAIPTRPTVDLSLHELSNLSKEQFAMLPPKLQEQAKQGKRDSSHLAQLDEMMSHHPSPGFGRPQAQKLPTSAIKRFFENRSPHVPSSSGRPPRLFAESADPRQDGKSSFARSSLQCFDPNNGSDEFQAFAANYDSIDTANSHGKSSGYFSRDFDYEEDSDEEEEEDDEVFTRPVSFARNSLESPAQLQLNDDSGSLNDAAKKRQPNRSWLKSLNDSEELSAKVKHSLSPRSKSFDDECVIMATKRCDKTVNMSSVIAAGWGMEDDRAKTDPSPVESPSSSNSTAAPSTTSPMGESGALHRKSPRLSVGSEIHKIRSMVGMQQRSDNLSIDIESTAYLEPSKPGDVAQMSAPSSFDPMSFFSKNHPSLVSSEKNFHFKSPASSTPRWAPGDHYPTSYRVVDSCGGDAKSNAASSQAEFLDERSFAERSFADSFLNSLPLKESHHQSDDMNTSGDILQHLEQASKDILPPVNESSSFPASKPDAGDFCDNLFSDHISFSNSGSAAFPVVQDSIPNDSGDSDQAQQVAPNPCSADLPRATDAERNDDIEIVDEVSVEGAFGRSQEVFSDESNDCNRADFKKEMIKTFNLGESLQLDGHAPTRQSTANFFGRSYWSAADPPSPLPGGNSSNPFGQHWSWLSREFEKATSAPVDNVEEPSRSDCESGRLSIDARDRSLQQVDKWDDENVLMADDTQAGDDPLMPDSDRNCVEGNSVVDAHERVKPDWEGRGKWRKAMTRDTKPRVSSSRDDLDSSRDVIVEESPPPPPEGSRRRRENPRRGSASRDDSKLSEDASRNHCVYNTVEEFFADRMKHEGMGDRDVKHANRLLSFGRSSPRLRTRVDSTESQKSPDSSVFTDESDSDVSSGSYFRDGDEDDARDDYRNYDDDGRGFYDRYEDNYGYAEDEEGIEVLDGDEYEDPDDHRRRRRYTETEDEYDDDDDGNVTEILSGDSEGEEMNPNDRVEETVCEREFAVKRQVLADAERLVEELIVRVGASLEIGEGAKTKRNTAHSKAVSTEELEDEILIFLNDIINEVDPSLQLSPEQADIYEDLFPAVIVGPPDEVLIDDKALEVSATRFSLKKLIEEVPVKMLTPKSHVNDEIINSYMSLIRNRSMQCSDLPKVFTFSTFFFESLRNGGHDRVKRWTRGKDIFQYDMILVPLNFKTEHHWALFLIDLSAKAFVLYDSLLNRDLIRFKQLKLNKQVKIVRLFQDYLVKEIAHKKSSYDLNVNSFKIDYCARCPEQRNLIDCGVFSMRFAEAYTRRGSIDFCQAEMLHYRKQICLELFDLEVPAVPQN